MTSNNPFNSSELRAVLGLASLYCLRMLGLFMVLPLFAVYAQSLSGANETSIGFALGAYGLSQALLQVPLGWLSDQVGRKPVILLGLALLTIGSLVAASADSVALLSLGRLLQGSGAIASATMALAADYTRPEVRTKASAVMGASIGLSFVLALIVGPILGALGGLARVFEVTACLGMLGVVVVLVLLPAAPVISEGGSAHLADRKRVGEALHGSGLPTMYLSIFCLHLMLMAAFTSIPLSLVKQGGLAPEHHSWVYLVSLCISLPGVAILVSLRNRFGSDPRSLIIYTAALALTGLVIALTAHAMLSLILGLVLFFTGFTALETVLPAWVSIFAPQKVRGTAMGIFASAQFLGIFAGGLLGGSALNIGGPILLISSLTVVTGVWFLGLWRFGTSSVILFEETITEESSMSK